MDPAPPSPPPPAAVPPPPPVTPPPLPPMSSASPARTWEMLCHLSALAGFVIPLGNLLGPFLVWQLKKNEHPSVDTHGKQALNFQLSCLIYAIVSALLIVAVIGVPLLAAVGLFDLICVIIATIKVNNGQPWKYPLSLTLIR